MTARLSKLHSRLRALRRRRRLVRWSTGYTALLLAVPWLLVALFLADWLLRMDPLQRIIGMVICAGVLVWALRRYTIPWLGQSETELDMALMVEKQKHIDTDVVAAIQFESPEAPQWGSVAMEQAVIEQTARLGERLEVTEGIPKAPLRRRTMALLLTAALLGAVTWRFPDYAGVFLNRLLLGVGHYPTRTRIETVQINGRALDLRAWGSQAVKVSYGQAVRFEVTCTGDLPESGEVSMKTLRGGLAAHLTLTASAANAKPDAERPSNNDSPLPQAGEGQGVRASSTAAKVYAGEIPRLLDSVEYHLSVGDAWADPAKLLVVALPVAEVQLEVAPPPYAADTQSGGLSPLGMRQVAVLEGSQVTLRVHTDKRLKQARVTIEGRESPLALARDEDRHVSAEQDCWKLEPAETPLAAVTEAIRYAVQVRDVDDLELERPIQGVIRINADQPPRVAASILTRFVLPAARPTVSYAASDEFGLGQLSIVPQVLRTDGRTEAREEIVFYRLPGGRTPPRSLQEGYRLDLAPLKLVKGDQLKIAVRATDYRGAERGKSSLSESLLFQVTDEAGILAAISEADKESARQLKIMIERQIDVGEGR